MSFLDLFKPVSDWDVDRVREQLAHHPDDYQLLDVRLLSEYSEFHLPGARWIPAGELSKRLEELDPHKTTIVYCAMGVRSRAAVHVLNNAGFTDAHNMKGGIKAWQGHVATGLPETLQEHFAAAETASDHAVLAWALEENTRCFYDELADRLSDEPAVAALFAELAAAENHHKESLQAIWEALESRPAPDDFPQGLLPTDIGRRMEGGMDLDEALDWCRDHRSEEIVELAMAIEINAYDHYLTLYRTAEDDNVRRIFEVLAVEENHHLKDLGALLEKRLPVT